MSKSDQQVTIGDAREALASIDTANKITLSSMRPPLWLVLLCAFALGVTTVAMGLMINDNLWNGIQWVSYIVCCLSVAFWIVALRVKGITIKIADVNITRKGVVSALLICILVILSRVIYLQTGSTLFPYVAGFLNTLILASSLHFGRLLDVKMPVKEKVGSNE